MISAAQYLKIKSHMTAMCYIDDCKNCPLDYTNNGLGLSCKLFEYKYPKEAVKIVEQWEKEHPIKTYLSDFLEKYPKANLGENGTPKGICPSDLGLEDIDKEGYDCSRCVECWNQEL